MSIGKVARGKGRPKKVMTKDFLVGARVDERTKYLVEMAARAQGITASRLITELLFRALDSTHVESVEGGGRVTVASVADHLWDGDEIDRFLKLTFEFPSLLTYDQRTLKKLISDVFYLLRLPFENGPATRRQVRDIWWQLNVAASSRLAASRVADALRGDPKAGAELASLRAGNSQWAVDCDAMTQDDSSPNR